MSDRQIIVVLTTLKIALAFLNGFCGILAAYPGPELPPLARLAAAGIVAGCGAVLLIVDPPGGRSDFTETQVDQLSRRILELRSEAMRRQYPNALTPTQEAVRG